ncbi:MAG: hypothetical protein ACI9YO_000342 [Gammaproteobacteria bacterium]|jgi:hypothetical protein
MGGCARNKAPPGKVQAGLSFVDGEISGWIAKANSPYGLNSNHQGIV